MKKLYAWAVAVTALLTASCTVSEPDDIVEGDDVTGSDVRLETLSVNGIFPVLNYQYDSNKRVTSINSGDEVYEFSYDPFEITDSEYDGDEHSLRSRIHWHDIRLNSMGYVLSAQLTDTDYTVAGGAETETYYVNFSYNDDGHLASAQDIYGSTVFIWDGDGRLTKMVYTDFDTDHNDSFSSVFKYSDVENTRLQWDPNLPVIGPLQATGFFGVAPSYFPMSVTTTHQGYYSYNEFMQFSYRVNANGYITASRMTEEGQTIQLSWSYCR